MSLFCHSPQYLFTKGFEQTLFLYRGIIERLQQVVLLTASYRFYFLLTFGFTQNGGSTLRLVSLVFGVVQSIASRRMPPYAPAVSTELLCQFSAQPHASSFLNISHLPLLTESNQPIRHISAPLQTFPNDRPLQCNLPRASPSARQSGSQYDPLPHTHRRNMRLSDVSVDPQT